MIRFPRVASACPIAMAMGVLPDPPAVRLPMQMIRALGRKGRARRKRARTEMPYNAPSGASNAAMAFAATLSLVQNSGARMGHKRFRSRDSGRKRASQTIGCRFGAGPELGRSGGIGNQLLDPPRQFFGAVHPAHAPGGGQGNEDLLRNLGMPNPHHR